MKTIIKITALHLAMVQLPARLIEMAAYTEFDTSRIPHFTDRARLQARLDGSRTIRQSVPSSCEPDSSASVPIAIFVRQPHEEDNPLIQLPCACCGAMICAKINLERQTPEGTILEVAWSHPIPGEKFPDGSPMYAGALYPVKSDLA